MMSEPSSYRNMALYVPGVYCSVPVQNIQSYLQSLVFEISQSGSTYSCVLRPSGSEHSLATPENRLEAYGLGHGHA